MPVLDLVCAVAFGVVMAVGFPRLAGRTRGGREPITPQRTTAVALLTLAAAVTALVTSLIADHQPWQQPWYSHVRHPLFHLLWTVLAVAIAFGLHRFRTTWLATGWTKRCLAAAELLVRAVVAGNILATVGAAVAELLPDPTDVSSGGIGFSVFFLVFHTGGEFLALGAFAVLLLVCLVMLGVGVRGVRRPTAFQPS